MSINESQIEALERLAVAGPCECSEERHADGCVARKRLTLFNAELSRRKAAEAKLAAVEALVAEWSLLSASYSDLHDFALPALRAALTGPPLPADGNLEEVEEPMAGVGDICVLCGQLAGHFPTCPDGRLARAGAAAERLRVAEARIATLEAALRDAREALVRQRFAGVSWFGVISKIDAALAQPVGGKT